MVNNSKTNGKNLPPIKKSCAQWIPQICRTPSCIKHSNALAVCSSKKITLQKVLISAPLLFKNKYPMYLGKTQPIGLEMFCSKTFYSPLFWSVRNDKISIYGNVALTSFLSGPNACKSEKPPTRVEKSIPTTK